MNEKLLIELIKIIKQSKQPILKVFEHDYEEVFVDFENVLGDIQKQTKRLANAIKKEAKTFNQNYESEEKMIKSVKSSFETISLGLKELIIVYAEIKSQLADENIQALLSFLIVQKILSDYILWCEKLENALLGIGKDEAIFVPNVIIESKVIDFIIENTQSRAFSFWLPFLSGVGVGFLLDDG